MSNESGNTLTDMNASRLLYLANKASAELEACASGIVSAMGDIDRYLATTSARRPRAVSLLGMHVKDLGEIARVCKSVVPRIERFSADLLEGKGPPESEMRQLFCMTRSAGDQVVQGISSAQQILAALGIHNASSAPPSAAPAVAPGEPVAKGPSTQGHGENSLLLA